MHGHVRLPAYANGMRILSAKDYVPHWKIINTLHRSQERLMFVMLSVEDNVLLVADSCPVMLVFFLHDRDDDHYTAIPVTNPVYSFVSL